MPQIDYRKRAFRSRPTTAAGVYNRRAELIRKSVFFGSVALFVCAVIVLLDFYVLGIFGFFSDNRAARDPNSISNKPVNFENTDVGVIDWTIPATGSNGGGAELSSPETVRVEILEKYREFFEANNEFVGYLSIDPHINYPVAWRAFDNDYYLEHNFDGNPMERGTVFADGWGHWSLPDSADGNTGRPDNVILHGHDLRVRALFSPLKDYVHGRYAFRFLKENAVIRFDTLFEEGMYKIFAVSQINAEEYLGEVFPYWLHSHFESDDHFYEYVVEMLDRSQIHTDVDLRPGDQILTLSTCDPTMFNPDVRIVISARRVRPGESLEMGTDSFVDLRAINRGRDENRFMRYMMFDYYYRVMNNQRGWVGRHSRNWDTSRVEGLNAFLHRNVQFLEG
ncbi:MAG: class B sortase [Oscillospiraceae bacterium]|nr:class B sortase [Oscillospiraceae bacterium]